MGVCMGMVRGVGRRAGGWGRGRSWSEGMGWWGGGGEEGVEEEDGWMDGLLDGRRLLDDRVELESAIVGSRVVMVRGAMSAVGDGSEREREDTLFS